MTRTGLAARTEQLRADRVPFVWATVVRAERPTSAKPGDTALVFADGTTEGFVGGSCAEATVLVQSLQALASGQPILVRITPDAASETAAPDASAPGLVQVNNPCLSGGTLEIFLEPSVPAPLVLVWGQAPIAQALLAGGAALGFDARPADERAAIPADAAAVVVATHGRDETAALRAAIAAEVPYIGLVASRRRGAAVLEALGLDERTRALIHTPAGLDIGARTPPEVALSILAEIVTARAQPRPSRRPAPVAVVAAVATDPVCGMTVAIHPGALHLVQGGQDHWFCGSGCRDAFAHDPGRYLRT